jgi:hypothetical protein
MQHEKLADQPTLNEQSASRPAQLLGHADWFADSDEYGRLEGRAGVGGGEFALRESATICRDENIRRQIRAELERRQPRLRARLLSIATLETSAAHRPSVFTVECDFGVEHDGFRIRETHPDRHPEPAEYWDGGS